MSIALTIIRTLKWISTLCLVGTVVLGTYAIDRRFTILLLPPFLMFWGQTRSFADIPIFKVLMLPLKNKPMFFQNGMLAVAGIGTAYALDLMLAPTPHGG
tara:strand:- start:93 stop:392 length:300 start_codon:yes stop_codon:yes gene_type:complete